MLTLDIKKNFDLNKLSFDYTETLNKGIYIIAKDIESGIEQGAQFNRPFKRNAKKTITKKGFDHPLKETGLMMNSKQMVKTKATKQRKIAILAPNDDRVDIAAWNDQGTDRIPSRPFWGISQDSENKIMLQLKKDIDKKFRKI